MVSSGPSIVGGCLLRGARQYHRNASPLPRRIVSVLLLDCRRERELNVPSISSLKKTPFHSSTTAATSTGSMGRWTDGAKSENIGKRSWGLNWRIFD